ncbi:ribosomal protein S5 domain 2-type protein [Lipomyces arxii]|uniref:ribosomal protein S5 domain 2-type protein n=1 Tax=Lipomyces arxii TaxID=56418 RepID=UPI0034CD282A
MPLSIAEESYLNSSLAMRPPCRPDGRDQMQLRPIDAATGILPTTNGSARIRLGDGGECIVGVKAEVITATHTSEAVHVEVDCDIAGVQSTDFLHNLLCSTLESAIRKSIPWKLLRITGKYRYKLFVDGVILDHASHPLTLFSMTTYLALLDTRIPELAPDSRSPDEDENENVKEDVSMPQYSNDWDEAEWLCKSWLPPLVLLGIVVSKNVFVDATGTEAEVSDGGLLTVWHEGRLVSVRVVNTKDSPKQVFSVSSLSNAIDVLSKASKEVERALKNVSHFA